MKAVCHHYAHSVARKKAWQLKVAHQAHAKYANNRFSLQIYGFLVVLVGVKNGVWQSIP
jgi:hypothetical protein